MTTAARQESTSDTTDAIRAALDVLFQPGDVVELRMLDVPRIGTGTVSGYFNEPDKLAAAAGAYDGKAPGVYVVINPCKPELLARAVNRVKERPKQTTSDSDIQRRCWFPIDADPNRPAGISSSESEHAAALILIEAVRDFLVDELEWSAESIVVADSGNGAHALVRIDLPNDDGATDLLKRCLAALDLRFSSGQLHTCDGRVGIDLTTYNASRIWKLYGVQTGKGDSTPDRPHRRSRLLHVPEKIEILSRESLDRLAALAPDPAKHSNGKAHHGPGFDVETFINTHLSVIRTGTWNGGKKWVVICPFNPQHDRGEAVVIQFAGGALAFRCHHNSCTGKDWQELREHFEPGCYEDKGREEDGKSETNGTASTARWRLLTAEEIEQQPQRPELVADILPAGSFGAIVAPPGAGKTTLLLDLALCIATGIEWHGRAVLKGPVVIVAAEGAGGLGVRLRVWKRMQAWLEPASVYFLPHAANLMQREEVTALLKAIERLPSPPVLVATDTLARCMVGGEENSAKDTGLWIAGADRIRAETGAALVATHHTPKAGNDLRGSSALRGAADTVILLNREDDMLTMICDKQKDSAPFSPVQLALRVIELPDGESAQILTDKPAVATDCRPRRLPESRQRVLDALRDLDHGEGATAAEWARMAVIPERTFHRAVKDLLAWGLVAKRGHGRIVRYFRANLE